MQKISWYMVKFTVMKMIYRSVDLSLDKSNNKRKITEEDNLVYTFTL